MVWQRPEPLHQVLMVWRRRFGAISNHEMRKLELTAIPANGPAIRKETHAFGVLLRTR